VLLFQPVLDDPAGYIEGGGKDSQIYLGAFLEFLLDRRDLEPGGHRVSETSAGMSASDR